MSKKSSVCKYGHRMSGRNLLVSSGKRRCRACLRRRSRESYKRNYVPKRPREHAYPPAPDRIVSWAAGLFEGEGTISIVNGGYLGYTRSTVQVTNTDAEIIDIFQRYWPGHIVRFRPRGTNARPVIKWELNSRPKICAFLRVIAPEIRTSRNRARIALMLEAEAFRLQGTHKSGYKKACQQFRERMRILNRRGVHASPSGSRK